MSLINSADSNLIVVSPFLFAHDVVAGGKKRENGSLPSGFDGVPARNQALVCVVDPDGSMRKHLNRLFRPEKYEIEFFASSQHFLNRKVHEGPCSLVVDDQAPGLRGIDLLQFLSRNRRTEQIVLISGEGDIATCAEAFKAGVVDFLTKPLKNAQLLSAVESGLRRSAKLFRLQKEKQAAESMLDQLTPREVEVLQFVIAGRLNKEIASELGTSEKTIKKHRGHFMKKLQIQSVAELVRFSLESGLQPAPPMGD